MITSTKEDRDFERKERNSITDFMEEEDVANVFKTYDRQLRFVYKYYASMDLAKEQTFDLEYLHSALSLREFVRFGYQMRVVPEFVSPDDMVFIYKCLVHETKDAAVGKTSLTVLEKNQQKSGQIDYDAFLKGLVRVACNAQNKLGDSLQAALAKETDQSRIKKLAAGGSKLSEEEKRRAKDVAQKRAEKQAVETAGLRK
jgi:hypothetical protein